MTRAVEWKRILRIKPKNYDLIVEEGGVVYRGPLKKIFVDGTRLHTEQQWIAVRNLNGWKKSKKPAECDIDIDKVQLLDFGRGLLGFYLLTNISFFLCPHKVFRLKPEFVKGCEKEN